MAEQAAISPQRTSGLASPAAASTLHAAASSCGCTLGFTCVHHSRMPPAVASAPAAAPLVLKRMPVSESSAVSSPKRRKASTAAAPTAGFSTPPRGLRSTLQQYFTPSPQGSQARFAQATDVSSVSRALIPDGIAVPPPAVAAPQAMASCATDIEQATRRLEKQQEALRKTKQWAALPAHVDGLAEAAQTWLALLMTRPEVGSSDLPKPWTDAYKALKDIRVALVTVLERLTRTGSPPSATHRACFARVMELLADCQRIHDRLRHPDQPVLAAGHFFSNKFVRTLNRADPAVTGFLRPEWKRHDAVFSAHVSLCTAVPAMRVPFTRVAHVIHDFDALSSVLHNGAIRLQGFNRMHAETGDDHAVAVVNAAGHAASDRTQTVSAYQGLPLLWFGPAPEVHDVNALISSRQSLSTQGKRIHAFRSPPFDCKSSRYGCIRVSLPLAHLLSRAPNAYLLGTRHYKQEWCHSILLTRRAQCFAIGRPLEQPSKLAQLQLSSASANDVLAATNAETTRFEWRCSRSNTYSQHSAASSSSVAAAAVSSSAVAATDSSAEHGWDHLDFALDVSADEDEGNTLVLGAASGASIDFVTHCIFCVQARHSHFLPDRRTPRWQQRQGRKRMCTECWEDVQEIKIRFLQKLQELGTPFGAYALFFEEPLRRELQALLPNVNAHTPLPRREAFLRAQALERTKQMTGRVQCQATQEDDYSDTNPPRASESMSEQT